jgi:hypothetical protein
MSRTLLNFLEDHTDQSLGNVYTADETWSYLENRLMSIWIGADVARPTRAQPTVASKKRMLWMDFSRTYIRAGVNVHP